MPLRKDGIETKKKILAVCVRLFLEQGYRETTISQIVEEAGVARGSFQNLFPTKDAVLMELVKPMFGGQFGVARGLVGDSLPPVYAYAAETAIQLTLTELNESLREIYLEAYTLPDTAEYIYLHTTATKWTSARRGLCAAIWPESATSIFPWSGSSSAFSRRPCGCIRCRRRSRRGCWTLSQGLTCRPPPLT